jgi:hypothetical protein
MPKTGFSNGFADVPTKKYYKYHGWVRSCNTEPVLPPYLEFPTDVPYGPPVIITLGKIEFKNREQNGFDYNVVHDSLLGAEYSRYVGQLRWDLGGGWYDFWVGRMMIGWDTSSIPSNAKIVSAKLMMKIIAVKKDSPFSVTIRSGMPDFPHMPVEDVDYYYGNYSGDYGSTLAENPGNYEIYLNPSGILLINKNGYTKFCLLSDRDILAIPPFGPESFEYVTLESWCKLRIIYKVPI